MQDFQECRPTNALSLANKQAGYSSVGRASDCRHSADIRSSLVRFRVAGRQFSAWESIVSVFRTPW